MSMKKAVFSIVSKNYLHFARTLMASLAVAHPDWLRYVLLVDEISGDFDPTKEDFNMVDVLDLPLPELKKFIFRYSILELNTAVKPWMIKWLFDQGFDQVVYLDPDILVYRKLAEVEMLLKNGAMMVLTPHLTGQLDDDKHPSELDIMRSGSYNLGFIALNRHSQLKEFLHWWQAKLEYQCVVNPEAGLFTDQKWIDLAPGLFKDVSILRHPGYNVAYWNLKHRKVKRRSDGYCINGKPLIFFHYSGLDPMQPGNFSKHQNRYTLDALGPVKPLVEDYCKKVKKHGIETCVKYRYVFNQFDDGTPIHDFIRICYRENPHLQKMAGGNPFAAKEIYNLPARELAGGTPEITELMKIVWERRVDLKLCFSDIQGRDRVSYTRWFAEGVKTDHQIPDCFIQPAMDGLSMLPDTEESEIKTTTVLKHKSEYRLAELVQAEDADFITNAYRAIMQRPSDLDGLNHYLSELRAGISKIEILSRLRFSAEGRRIGVRIPGLLLFFLLGRLGRWLPWIRRLFMDYLEHPPPTAKQALADEKENHTNFAPYSGFFDYNIVGGRKLVWMTQHARVKICPVKAGDVLRVSGEYDGESHRMANGSDAVLSLFLNNRQVGEFRFSDSGEFEKKLSLAVTLDDAVLALHANQVFVPAELGKNDDFRKLALRIAKIEINDQVVLDFSDTHAPYKLEIQREAVGVNIVGYVKSEHGVGQSARSAASCCKAAELPFCLIDFSRGTPIRQEDHSWAEYIEEANHYNVNLFHINADQMHVAHGELGQGFFDQHYNIGYWAWELQDFPNRFLQAFNYLNEIWVPSRFVQEAVSAKSQLPVIRMPHAIDIELEQHLTRQQIGLPDEGFLFLTMYDIHSMQERKNPQAALAAFEKAFPDAGDVKLVIKTHNGDVFPKEFAKLKNWVADRQNVHLITETLSRQEVYNLENLCDCFISLHRSEGFGFALAECMLLCKPVIATNWSGNTDFMNADNSLPVQYELTEIQQDIGPYNKGQLWAEADVDHAAWQMKRVVEDLELRQKIAVRGQNTIRDEYSPQAIGRRYAERLAMIARR